MNQETETDMLVRSIVEKFSVRDKQLKEIRQKQRSDKIYSQAINLYKVTHWPETVTQDPELRPYLFVRQYLTVYQGLIVSEPIRYRYRPPKRHLRSSS